MHSRLRLDHWALLPDIWYVLACLLCAEEGLVHVPAPWLSQESPSLLHACIRVTHCVLSSLNACVCVSALLLSHADS